MSATCDQCALTVPHHHACPHAEQHHLMESCPCGYRSRHIESLRDKIRNDMLGTLLDRGIVSTEDMPYAMEIAEEMSGIAAEWATRAVIRAIVDVRAGQR